MHDNRWIDRFLYSWSDSIYYQPLDVFYTPKKDHFLTKIDKEFQQKFTQSGIWWGTKNDENLPAQGWKIHISADYTNANEIISIASEYLLKRETNFKFALDMNILELLNSKAMSRSNSGKFITIYPNNHKDFLIIIEDLYKLLSKFKGPYILSDIRYKDSKCLYFRYGQFHNLYTLDAMGIQHSCIVHPEGHMIPDERSIQQAMPEWVNWPFEDWEASQPHTKQFILNSRFEIIEPISFSNSGGVYKARDLKNNDIVVVKEARPLTNFNSDLNYDSQHLIKREWEILSILSETNRFPKPIDFFDEWEHTFLVEEYIEGNDIREILFEHNPLVRLVITNEASKNYLNIFIKVFHSFATGIYLAHQKDIVVGDLSANNFLIDKNSYDVKIIDLEGGRLISEDPSKDNELLKKPIEMFTPGFRHSKREGSISEIEDDLFGLAGTMAYFIYPIASMSYLRQDTLKVYETYLNDLGWPKSILNLINGLASNSISIEEAIEVLDCDSLLDVVKVPEKIDFKNMSRQFSLSKKDETLLEETKISLSNFISSSEHKDRPFLFPVDPFSYVTNPLSLGFGVSGILYAYKKCGLPIKEEWKKWFSNGIEAMHLDEYSAGLMNGLSGLCWTLLELEDLQQIEHLLQAANQKALLSGDYTFYYGSAGVGMTNLYMYQRTGLEYSLNQAKVLANELIETANYDGQGVYWENSFKSQKPYTGLGFGQSGVALFLLRLYQVTKDSSYLNFGEKALSWEVAQGVKWEEDALVFEDDDGTQEIYVEVGSAGVAKVLLRYGKLEQAKPFLKAIQIDHTVMLGYLFGMNGIVDTLIDASIFLKDSRYHNVAFNQFQNFKSTFMFHPEVEGIQDTTMLAVPGEGLLRCSCDFGTGAAGVMRVTDRLFKRNHADFMLDEMQK